VPILLEHADLWIPPVFAGKHDDSDRRFWGGEPGRETTIRQGDERSSPELTKLLHSEIIRVQRLVAGAQPAIARAGRIAFVLLVAMIAHPPDAAAQLGPGFGISAGVLDFEDGAEVLELGFEYRLAIGSRRSALEFRISTPVFRTAR
jgi:hypothetical protein